MLRILELPGAIAALGLTASNTVAMHHIASLENELLHGLNSIRKHITKTISEDTHLLVIALQLSGIGML